MGINFPSQTITETAGILNVTGGTAVAPNPIGAPVLPYQPPQQYPQPSMQPYQQPYQYPG